MNIKVKISMKEKKLGGRPKLPSYLKRTKCFRVMFTENDYIYIQSKAEQAGMSLNEFCHQAAMGCEVTQRISLEMASAIRDLSGMQKPWRIAVVITLSAAIRQYWMKK